MATLRSCLYGVQLDRERDLALQNARAMTEESRVLADAGQRRAADVLLAAARVYQESAVYWERELQHLHGAGKHETRPDDTRDASNLSAWLDDRPPSAPTGADISSGINVFRGYPQTAPSEIVRCTK
jgi:hypothetical protein